MTLPSFRDYIVKREAEAAAKTAAQVRAEEAVAAAQDKIATECSSLASALIQYFTARDDEPSAKALARIRACGDLAVLTVWLRRAYNGETSAQIFGGVSGS